MSLHPDAHDIGICSRCTTELPAEVAFCHACGGTRARTAPPGAPPAELDPGRRRHGAVHPTPPVRRPHIVTTLTPQLHGTAPSTYRLALGGSIVVVSMLALLGWHASALTAAALVVPTLVARALADVNAWHDKAGLYVGASFGLAGVLAAATTLLWSALVTGTDTLTLSGSGSGTGTGTLGPASLSLGIDGQSWTIGSLAVTVVAAPAIATVLRAIGPLLVTAHPRFDDLIDRVNLGVATGVTWAAVEALVLDHGLLTGTSTLADQPITAWVAILTAGIATPIAIGAAAALAAAAIPSPRTLGALAGSSDAIIADLPTRYERRHARRQRRVRLRARGRPLLRHALATLVEAGTYAIAIAAARAIGVGIGGLPGALAWAAITLTVGAIVLVRLRTALHRVLLDTALQAAHDGHLTRHAAIGDAWCGHCEHQLVDRSAFCSACGMAVRAAGRRRRTFNKDPHTRLILARTRR